jgi:hypothetical protein
MPVLCSRGGSVASSSRLSTAEGGREELPEQVGDAERLQGGPTQPMRMQITGNTGYRWVGQEERTNTRSTPS